MIDNTLPEYADCPATLNGEILLERTVPLAGWLTITREKALELQAQPSTWLEEMGYSPAHITIIREVA